ncbi:MAG: NAD-dependent epimerase/dehydratase family protein [Bacteroidia bacterium]|nr:NAD-dependent epimerase/dehydratase family protein [Bacteroidia bacterium]
MKKVLLTGADGFLGSNIVRELLARGYLVRAFIESGKNLFTLKGLDIELVSGDILSPADVMNAAEGCNYIIHAAASTSLWPPRSEITRRVNIDGTRNIIEAALIKGSERLIHIGTANSFGFGSKSNPGDESKPYKAFRYKTDYIDSKYEAHKLVLDSVTGHGLNAVVLNPTFMLGAYDSKPSSGAMILAVAGGKVPGYTRGGRNYIYVKDAAKGVVNALEKGEKGESYILGNQNLSYREIFSLIAETIGAKKPGTYIPPALSLGLGSILTLFSKITGKAPLVSLAMARISNDEHYFTAAKARTKLDLPQTDIRTAIVNAFAWFKENNYV